jgi:hypothetical protein
MPRPDSLPAAMATYSVAVSPLIKGRDTSAN